MANIIRDGLTWIQRYDALISDDSIQKIRKGTEGKTNREISDIIIKAELKTSAMLNVPLDKIVPFIIKDLLEIYGSD